MTTSLPDVTNPRRSTLVAAALVLLGTVLRMGQLFSVEFKLDEQEAVNLGLRLLDARPWATSAPWPATGMRSSQGILNAPLFNYFMALFWALTGAVASATGMVGLFNAAALVPFYRWCRALFAPRVALLALGAAALSPFAIIYSRKLWAQDLLFPFLVLLMWGLWWIHQRRFWWGLAASGLAMACISQLHQSGPFMALVLGLLLGIHLVRGRRKHGSFDFVPRAGPWDAMACLLVVQLWLFLWIPYLRYLLGLPPNALANRPKLDFVWPALLWKLALQLVPYDLFTFFEPHQSQFFTQWSSAPIAAFFRLGGFAVACAVGAVLGLWGFWGWARRPSSVPFAGVLWWLVVVVFTAMRILGHPHYVLILAPLPSLMVAGAFDPPALSERVASILHTLRWAYLAALLCLGVGTQAWLVSRGGAEGDYGIMYGVREAQARAALALNAGEPHPDEMLVIPEEKARTGGCNEVGGEVTWLIRQWKGEAFQVSKDVKLCQLWYDVPGGKQYGWRVIR